MIIFLIYFLFLLIVSTNISTYNYFQFHFLLEFDLNFLSHFNMYLLWVDSLYFTVFLLLVLNFIFYKYKLLLAFSLVYIVNASSIDLSFLNNQTNFVSFNFFNPLLYNSLNKIHPFILHVTFLYSLKYAYITFYNKFFMIIWINRNINIYVYFYSFLTTLFGAWWAFQEGTWGGWWDWDPSELLSLFIIGFFLIFSHYKLSISKIYYISLFNFLFILFIFFYFYTLQINISLTAHNFGNFFLIFFNNFYFNLLIINLIGFSYFTIINESYKLIWNFLIILNNWLLFIWLFYIIYLAASPISLIDFNLILLFKVFDIEFISISIILVVFLLFKLYNKKLIFIFLQANYLDYLILNLCNYRNTLYVYMHIVILIFFIITKNFYFSSLLIYCDITILNNLEFVFNFSYNSILIESYAGIHQLIKSFFLDLFSSDSTYVTISVLFNIVIYVVKFSLSFSFSVLLVYLYNLFSLVLIGINSILLQLITIKLKKLYVY